MSNPRAWLKWRRQGAGDTLLLFAREVTDRHRSVQSGLAEVRQPALLDRLDEEDFRGLDEVIADQAAEDHEYAVVLARLTLAAARAKGFDDETVDATLRLDSLLPGDDPSRERDRLLRDAYAVAQEVGYVRGGRIALGRLGHRAAEAGDGERARRLFQQQLDLGDEVEDSTDEVDAALDLGDLLRREGDRTAAQGLYRRAGRAAQRLDHHRGIAEALVRQIELLPSDTELETLAAIQRQAAEAARRTADLGLQSRIVLSLAATLRHNGKPEEAIAQLDQGLRIARQIGDLALEARCLAALAETEGARHQATAAVAHARTLVDLEERLGNRPAAAEWAIEAGSNLLDAGSAEQAILAYDRGLALAAAAGDPRLEQRALGGLGVAASLAGRSTEAIQHLHRALQIARRTHDPRHEARWLGGLGQVLWRAGQADDAITSTNEALEIARRLDDGALQAGLLTMLGGIHADRNQASRARECYGRAFDRYRRLGQTGEQIRVLIAQADLAATGNHVGGAIAFLEEALHLCGVDADQATAARLHGKIGALAQRRHDHHLALDHLRRAATLADAMRDPALLARALQHLAVAQHAADDPAATGTYRRAIEQSRSAGDPAGEAISTLNLGLLLVSLGEPEEGRLLLHGAATQARELGAAGSDLQARAESASRALPAAAAPLPPPTPFVGRSVAPLPAPRSPISDDAAAADDAMKDAVYREATLPPL